MALVLFRRLFAKPPSLVTSVLVITEGHAWFLRRFDRHRALQFLATVDAMSFVTVAPVGQEVLTSASTLLTRFGDQDLTMVDAIGLHMIESERLRSCWSTDRRLALTGAELVIHR